jgi:hypothetical protein
VTVLKRLAIGLILGLAAVPGLAPAAASVRSFADSLADIARGPDISAVQVGNDARSGDLVFWVRVANRPRGLLEREFGAVFVDVDRNPATGDQEGAEYALFVDPAGSGGVRWDGSGWVPAALPSLRSQFVASLESFRVSVAPSDLGGLREFGFFVGGYGASGLLEDTDFAPDDGSWPYAVAPGRLSLAVTSFAVTQRAGRSLSATLRLRRADTFDPVTSGTVRCRLRSGSGAVAVRTARFAGGGAVCRWSLPRAAKGMRVHGAVSVTYAGATVTRSFSARAR